VKKLLNPPPAIVALFVAGLAVLVGCDYQSTRQAGSTGKSGASSVQTQYRADVLRSAVSMLNAPERFDDEDKASGEIIDQLTQWIRMVRETKGAKASSKAVEDDTTVVAVDWQRDPLVETLPESMRRSRPVARLGSETFDANYDGPFLREAALLRDVAGSIQPAKLDDLSVGEAYFDWTVRNIQIEPPPQEDATPAEKWLAMHLPVETLYFGRGTPLGRAWVFMLLARQMGLDTVLLAMPDARNPEQPRPWAVGLVSGENIYLFDYTYGLPIPGPGGKGIATLAEAAADDAVLRQMDIPGDRIYPRKAADLEKTIALVEASPGYLSRRMKLLESHLTGQDRMVLTTDSSALADKLKNIKHVSEVRLWTMPFDVVAQRQQMLAGLEDETSADRPMALTMLRERELERMPFTIPVMPEEKRAQQEPQQELRPESREEIRRRERKIYALRLGRLLHLRGAYGGADPNDAAAARAGEEQSEIVERGAKAYYLRAMLTKQELDDINRMLREGFELTPGRRITKELVDAMQQMRDDAGYWLGLIWFAQDGYQTAEQFLRPLTQDLQASNQWANGARYNLARCYEAQGKFSEAIKLYEAGRSPQRYGNRLRAERLRGRTSEESHKKTNRQQ
jgi:tetratricopeptide (TPR) repeat protein